MCSYCAIFKLYFTQLTQQVAIHLHSHVTGPGSTAYLATCMERTEKTFYCYGQGQCSRMLE